LIIDALLIIDVDGLALDLLIHQGLPRASLVADFINPISFYL